MLRTEQVERASRCIDFQIRCGSKQAVSEAIVKYFVGGQIDDLQRDSGAACGRVIVEQPVECGCKFRRAARCRHLRVPNNEEEYPQ